MLLCSQGSNKSLGAALLRVAGALIVATWFVFHVRAENTIPPLNLDWFTATVPNNPRPKTPPAKAPLAIPVQEPYCEYGVGPCGGTCLEESGKRWYCPPTAVPCYQRGQHCTCE